MSVRKAITCTEHLLQTTTDSRPQVDGRARPADLLTFVSGVTSSHTTFTLSHHHRHPRCLAPTSSLQTYSNYSHRDHRSPTYVPLAGILTVSRTNPSLVSANSSSNCGKLRPQEYSALGKHPTWGMPRIPLSRMRRKPSARFVGRSGKSEERNCSKSQKTHVILFSPSLSPG